LRKVEVEVLELKQKVRELERKYVNWPRAEKACQLYSLELPEGSRTVAQQTSINSFVAEAEALEKDEVIRMYLKNKESGEILDYELEDDVPEGWIVVKRIHKRRDVKVLMRKFRSAVYVARLMGRMRKSS